jgi:hypothetical protein
MRHILPLLIALTSFQIAQACDELSHPDFEFDFLTSVNTGSSHVDTFDISSTRLVYELSLSIVTASSQHITNASDFFFDSFPPHLIYDYINTPVELSTSVLLTTPFQGTLTVAEIEFEGTSHVSCARATGTFGDATMFETAVPLSAIPEPTILTMLLPLFVFAANQRRYSM